MEAEKVLAEFGLSEKEARVYMILLRFGSATVVRIAKSAEIPRTTAYNILKSLKEKGLVSFVKKDRATHFEASDPKNMLLFLEEKERKLREVIPLLEKIKGSVTEKPEISIYEGRNAVRAVYADVLKNKKELKVIGNYNYFKEIMPSSADILIKQRVASSINCRFVGEKSKHSNDLKRRDREEMRQTRFLEELCNVKAECYIYGNKVALLTLIETEPIALIIENQELAKLLSMIFENVWTNVRK